MAEARLLCWQHNRAAISQQVAQRQSVRQLEREANEAPLPHLGSCFGGMGEADADRFEFLARGLLEAHRLGYVSEGAGGLTKWAQSTFWMACTPNLGLRAFQEAYEYVRRVCLVGGPTEEHQVEAPRIVPMPPLGIAALQSGLLVRSAVDLKQAMTQASGRFNTTSDLHAVFLLMSPDNEACMVPAWSDMRAAFVKLQESDAEVRSMVGIDMTKVRACAGGAGQQEDDHRHRAVCIRFYAAVVVTSLFRCQHDFDAALAPFAVSVRQAKQMQRDTGYFAPRTVAFCGHLKLVGLQAALAVFVPRLAMWAVRE